MITYLCSTEKQMSSKTNKQTNTGRVSILKDRICRYTDYGARCLGAQRFRTSLGSLASGSYAPLQTLHILIKLLSFISQVKPGLHRKLHIKAAKEPDNAALNPAEVQDCTHFSLMKTCKKAEPAFLELGI